MTNISITLAKNIIKHYNLNESILRTWKHRGIPKKYLNGQSKPINTEQLKIAMALINLPYVYHSNIANIPKNKASAVLLEKEKFHQCHVESIIAQFNELYNIGLNTSTAHDFQKAFRSFCKHNLVNAYAMIGNATLSNRVYDSRIKLTE